MDFNRIFTTGCRSNRRLLQVSFEGAGGRRRTRLQRRS